ncbi:tail fiber assembly protein [Budviciaceae bacterium CWB-B4]|uniref:Tail fiber assembly protein n=1 Tax=Limnobaculum xujianqingii TaxID=2738837 RepID=A0A9D7AKP2_9GAMM|nr:tail fiber assembly protein [Limnobaculum xujianqingii]MBK5074586.1 tail fiber assembly protein [Limnobaculum xujianqingii]MBK5177748.1 tail fiber assembly protein [Limnobaculum xujianqingii]
MIYFYSKTTNAFYFGDSKESYILSGTWPDDAEEISLEVVQEFISTPPSGKCRQPDENGMPSWGDIPRPSDEQITDSNIITRNSLVSRANTEIAWRQDAVDREEATEADVTDLTAWKKYRIQLMRIDLSNPLWPEIPNQQ